MRKIIAELADGLVSVDEPNGRSRFLSRQDAGIQVFEGKLFSQVTKLLKSPSRPPSATGIPDFQSLL